MTTRSAARHQRHADTHPTGTVPAVPAAPAPGLTCGNELDLGGHLGDTPTAAVPEHLMTNTSNHTRHRQGGIAPAMAIAAPDDPVLYDTRLYRVTDAMRVLSMSRSVIYEQIRAGRLRSVKQGRTRLIPASAIREYVALLEQEAEEAGK